MQCRTFGILLLLLFPLFVNAEPLKLGTRRELFVDGYVIDTGSLDNCELMIHRPADRGKVFQCRNERDRPYSMCFTTVIKDGRRYRLYYRTWPDAGKRTLAWRCAESADGIRWIRPNYGLCRSNGSVSNNIIISKPNNLAAFAPFIDTRPGIPVSQRYKAVALAIGGKVRRLFAYASPDGIRWSLMSGKPVMDEHHDGLITDHAALDSHNYAFYSETEGQYVMYLRDWKDGIRRIARTTSSDFLTWSACRLMEYRYADSLRHAYEHHYINSTHPYFRAPHIYLAPAARLVLNSGGEITSRAEAGKMGISISYYRKNKNHSSCSIFMTTRGNLVYDRLLPGRYIIPPRHVGKQMARSNFPGPCYVQTGPRELSLYVSHNYASNLNHLRRYALRLDGFGSLHAENAEGEAVTRPLTFVGRHLYLNYRTGRGGSIRIELLDDKGTPLTGFTQADAVPMTGDSIDGIVSWKNGTDLSARTGIPVRIRFIMKNADIYSMRFGRE